MTEKEKNYYHFSKYSNLIKGKYHQVIHYKNLYTDDLNIEFYYFKESLFYLKIKLFRKQVEKEDIVEKYDIKIDSLKELKKIKNTFQIDLNALIIQINKDILNKYKTY